ncbi:MAG: hypothetical protein II750_07265 [Bacteroidaceae bacterium]|nr:hypothetical protein [Bacteroidaceae bacterium]
MNVKAVRVPLRCPDNQLGRVGAEVLSCFAVVVCFDFLAGFDAACLCALSVDFIILRLISFLLVNRSACLSSSCMMQIYEKEIAL